MVIRPHFLYIKTKIVCQERTGELCVFDRGFLASFIRPTIDPDT